MTRFSPPRTQPWIAERPRLTDRFVDPGAGVVFVHGPAGSGKTTLMAQAHAQTQGADAAWLSIEELDNDPTRLWSAISDALAQLVPEFGRTYRSELRHGRPRIVDRIVPAVVAELVESGLPVRLFIDDVHLLHSAGSLRSLGRFIANRPPNLTLVMASRAAPNRLLPGRSRSHTSTLVEPEELAMNLGEALSVLGDHGVEVAARQAEALLAKTEGLPAGIRWAAMALQEETDVGRLIGTAPSTQDGIGQYFVEEVFQQLPEPDRRFLLETSILRVLTGELCDAVRDSSDSATQLPRLERSTALLTGTDQPDPVYRYHELVREVLQALLESESPRAVPGLHRRAAAWLQDRGQVEDAFHHALAADDRTLAADMLCGAWLELVSSGRIDTALALLLRFESAEITGYQPLAVTATFLHALDGDDRRSRAYYEAALAGRFSGPPPDGSADMKSVLAILRAAVAYEGINQSLADAELAYELEHEHQTSPWRALAALLVGVRRTRSGDPEGAAPFLEEVITARDPDEALAVYAQAEIALAQLERGETEAALASAERACARVVTSGLDTVFFAALAHGAAAVCNLAAGEVDAARSHLEAAVVPMEAVEAAIPIDAMLARLVLADAALGLGELDLAQSYLDAAALNDAAVPDSGVLEVHLHQLQDRFKREVLATGDVGLTDRELEVLGLLPSDLNNGEIGQQLYVAKDTIRTHVRRIYAKLGVDNRGDAIRAAQRLGLLPDE